jgi:hypothetical protein
MNTKQNLKIVIFIGKIYIIIMIVIKHPEKLNQQIRGYGLKHRKAKSKINLANAKKSKKPKKLSNESSRH